MSYLDDTGVEYLVSDLKEKTDAAYQEKLVSGTNIKTINSESILAVGNLNLMPISTSTLSNMNDATETGVYAYSSSTTNHPGSTNGTVIVFKTSSTYIYQMAFANNSSGNPTIYVRMHYSSSSWSSWKSITVS